MIEGLFLLKFPSKHDETNRTSSGFRKQRQRRQAAEPFEAAEERILEAAAKLCGIAEEIRRFAGEIDQRSSWRQFQLQLATRDGRRVALRTKAILRPDD